MANERVKVIDIDASAASLTINDLKNNIKLLKEELGNANLVGNEHQQVLVQLQANQAALRNAMHGTTASLKDIVDAATTSNITFDENNEIVNEETISYNELVKKLADLKQAWRTTTDEAERSKLGSQIDNVNDRLKEMDASVGTYGRNVGNYLGALQQFGGAFGNMGGAARQAAGGVKVVTQALNVLKAHPIVAVIAALVAILMKVIDALKSSEENMKGLNEAMAPFKVLGDALTNTLQAMGKVIVEVVGFFGKLTAAITGTNEATKKRIELAKMENDLLEQQREVTMRNADDETAIAELRLKASQKNQYTEEERLGFLRQAMDLEEQIAIRSRDAARQEYESIKLRNSLTQSSTAELKEQADAYARMMQTQTNYLNTMRRLASQEATIENEVRSSSGSGISRRQQKEAALKAEAEAYKNMLQAELKLLQEGSIERLNKQKELLAKEYEMQVKSAKNSIKNKETLNRTLLALQTQYYLDVENAERDHQNAVKNIQLLALQNQANVWAAGSLDNLHKLMDLRKYELDNLERQEGETNAAFQARKIAAQWAYYEAEKAYNEKYNAQALESAQLTYEKSSKTQEETYQYNLTMAEARLKQIQELGRQADESQAGYEIRLQQAQNEVTKATNELLNYQEQQDLLRMQNSLAALEEGSFEYLTKAIELKQYELDTLHKLETESEADFEARKAAKRKEVEAAEQAHYEALTNIVQGYVGNLSGIMGSIADFMEAGSEVSEKEAKKVKAVRIAAAIIDTISGATAAYMNAVKTTPGLTGQILGAAQAAAVTAAGMANVQKIRNTDISTGAGDTSTSSAASAASNASVSAPYVPDDVARVRTLTGASEEERLNRLTSGDYRVYILSSDLEANAGATRARVRETTF